MKPQKFSEQFATIYDLAIRLSSSVDADALIVLLDGPTDWNELRARAGREKILVAADTREQLPGAAEAGLTPVVHQIRHAPVVEKLTQTLLESVANDILEPGANVVAVYSGFEARVIDSVSLIRLDEHLGKLTARDLRKIETSVPLETLKIVVDLAVDIGREGREGKPIGTMFVVGDTRRVMMHCHDACYDPVKGYKRKERDLRDPRTRESVKEIALMDGAFIISSDAVIEKACQIIDADHANITLSKGLGTRHWAGAAISKITKAIAIVVSESNGTVRIFNNGEVILRIEPFRRAMKWKNFELETPPTAGPSPG